MGSLRLSDYECPFSIWVERDSGGGWSWELIDQDGETSIAGQARDQGEAMIAARRAAALALA